MKQSLSIIGVGAFGEFTIKHLAPYFDLYLYDQYKDLSQVKEIYNVTVTDFSEAMKSDIIVLAVPVQAIEETVEKMAPCLKKGQLIIDVASVKSKPVAAMKSLLPEGVNVVATHPIFGPQSGLHGISGKNIVVMNVRGDKLNCVAEFLALKLQLNVIQSTPEEHDQQMAYVPGPTHMIARIFKNMDVPQITQASRTYELLEEMVGLIKNDSDDLFRAIQTDNPYVADVKSRFFKSVKDLEDNLSDSKK